MSLGIGVGIGVGLDSSGDAVIASGPKNLLLWTEAFDNAPWTASNCSVVPNAATDPLGGVTAETATNLSAAGALFQVSTTTAGTGAATSEDVGVSAIWARRSVTGSFDSKPYVFSLYLKNPAGELRLTLDRSGGFLRCLIRDIGDETVYDVWGAQLEQSASPTEYEKREGT